MATTCKLIASQTLANSTTGTVTFSSIPSTFDDLLLVCSARGTYLGGPSDNIQVKPNGLTTNRSGRFLAGTGSSVVSGTRTTIVVGFMSTNAATASTFGNSECVVPNYAGSTNKSFSCTGVSETNATAVDMVADAGLWASTAAITSLELVPGLSTYFVSGSSFFLYGITKA